MGFFSSIGSVVNDVLGGTTSARRANQYALQQMRAQNALNKETMQNAHQWEVQDLQKAGLNPILAANGNTSALGASTPSGPQAATGSPFDMAARVFDMMNTAENTAKTKAEKELAEAQAAAQIAQNPYISEKAKKEIANLDATKKLTEAETNSAKATAKYTNERARGYTTSETRSTSSDFKVVGSGMGKTVSRTISKTR